MAVNALDVADWVARGARAEQRLTAAPTAFILDDDPAVATEISGVLRAHGLSVRAFTSGAAFLRAYRAEMPGCLVADPCVPGLSGLEVQRELLARGWELPVVFVTHPVDLRTTVLGMKAGAVTFLAKPPQAAELIEAVCEAIARDAANRAQLRKRAAVQAGLAMLTPREHQVLRLLATGMMNKQIAAELDVGEKTVKAHRGRILEKMQVPSAVALVALLHRVNLQIAAAAN